MTIPRRHVLDHEESVYHCISRCVRRAFLHGKDLYSGKNYDHRKDWIKARIQDLTKIFTIEVLAYALMDNHQHSILRTCPDLLNSLADQEVLQRWNLLYPKSRKLDFSPSPLTEEQLQEMLKNKPRIEVLRQRLNCISWFMKSFNEHIARLANKEYNCKGRFWEGRFKCQRLVGEAAILSCAVYIDLNPIRAKKADTPETSEHTSAFERIQALRNKQSDDSLWITPIADSKTRRGFLSVNLEEYISILDETGRSLKANKRGSISDSIAPILERLGICPEHWSTVSSTMTRSFSSIVGKQEQMQDSASALGKNWLKGLKLARVAYF
jgi:hypothetical protein